MLPSRFALASILVLAFGLSACATTSAPAPKDASSVSLPGVRYEVLKSGPVTGAHPRRADEIVVRYEGRLTNGQLFDSSASEATGTATFPLGKLIPGWVAVLQLMRQGDEWRIYLPAYMAYGEKGAGPIPPNSDLIFKVELVSIKSPPAN
jgi:peptidylprolyl isomerase/FKBP-type peptidyl-prolyl cis-trans isomerase FklB